MHFVILYCINIFLVIMLRPICAKERMYIFLYNGDSTVQSTKR